MTEFRWNYTKFREEIPTEFLWTPYLKVILFSFSDQDDQDTTFRRKSYPFQPEDILSNVEEEEVEEEMIVYDEEIVHPSGNLVNPSGNLVHPSGNLVNPSGNFVHPTENIVHPSGNLVNPSENLVHPSGNLVQLYPSGNLAHPPETLILDKPEDVPSKENTTPQAKLGYLKVSNIPSKF